EPGGVPANPAPAAAARGRQQSRHANRTFRNGLGNPNRPCAGWGPKSFSSGRRTGDIEGGQLETNVANSFHGEFLRNRRGGAGVRTPHLVSTLSDHAVGGDG